MKKILLVLLILLGVSSCKHSDDKLLGSWDNKDGQVIVFNNNEHALWIFYTGSERDTFDIRYKFNSSESPCQLDLTGFKTGPLTGKTLYGIVEFQDYNTFQFDCDPSSRPASFSESQTQVYHKTN